MTANYPSKRRPFYAAMVNSSGVYIGTASNPMVTSGGGSSSPSSIFNNESRSGNGTAHVTDTYELSEGTLTTMEAGLFLSITSSLPSPDPYTVANGTAAILTFSGGVTYDESGTVCEITDGTDTLLKIVVSVSGGGLQIDYTCTTGTITITGGDMSVARLFKV